ncbi:MAG TPA: hypothetical protein VMG09_07445 [Bacteroidota bacterium]|nr:hypothetical protein [Bacteroidota bacterium]
MKTNAILLKAVPIVLVVVLLKTAVHALGWEVISLNVIFSGIIGANVFLLGFLLSGVLSDYKESEKLPGELASAISTIVDELELAGQQKPSPAVRANLSSYAEFGGQVHQWFYKEVKTRSLLLRLKELYLFMGDLEGLILPNYLARMRQEHANLRRVIVRIHTIRDTSFVSSGYVIAVSTTFLIFLGIVIVKMDYFYESLFFTAIITYLMVFLILLIRDLDNPFDYSSKGSSEDVSLKPIEDVIAEMAKWKAAPEAVSK